MAITVHTGHAGDMHRVLPMFYRQLEERAAVDPAFFALRPDAAARFRRWIGPALEDPRHSVVVAEDDGAIVGCLVTTAEQDLPIYVHDEYAVVRLLWVDPAHRGKGVAGRLLDHGGARGARSSACRSCRACAAVSPRARKARPQEVGIPGRGNHVPSGRSESAPAGDE